MISRLPLELLHLRRQHHRLPGPNLAPRKPRLRKHPDPRRSEPLPNRPLHPRLPLLRLVSNVLLPSISFFESTRRVEARLPAFATSATEARPYYPSTSPQAEMLTRKILRYHGHSWAKGLFPSSDGKDQESTSEDAFFSYALKLWGRVTNDTAMEARGNLMLAIQKRSFRNYFLLESDNGNQPENFVANKVTGILFENKVDHTTYFGNRTEFVQGIHMIPINPSSAYTRDQGFVREEWERYFSGGRVDNVEGGWRGILYGNLAIIDPKASYNWVSGPDFNPIYLDDGATRTWYLAYAAGLGGAS